MNITPHDNRRATQYFCRCCLLLLGVIVVYFLTGGLVLGWCLRHTQVWHLNTFAGGVYMPFDWVYERFPLFNSFVDWEETLVWRLAAMAGVP